MQVGHKRLDASDGNPQPGTVHFGGGGRLIRMVHPKLQKCILPAFGEYLRLLFGRNFGENGFLALFSLRLDEKGNDGKSQYFVIGGAVATINQWKKLETAWDRLLSNRNVDSYHWVDFNRRQKSFDGWSDYKCKRFEESQKKIIKRNTRFRASVGIDKAVHKDIKARMRGIRGFNGDSDYGLCLRWLMFATSEILMKVDPDHRLAILIEAGPLAAGAASTYHRVAAMTGKWNPAKHAHRLVDFGKAPKGESRSLEAADYLAHSEWFRIENGKRRRQRNIERLSVVLTECELERWYKGMIREKETRLAYDPRGNKQ